MHTLEDKMEQGLDDAVDEIALRVRQIVTGPALIAAAADFGPSGGQGILERGHDGLAQIGRGFLVRQLFQLAFQLRGVDDCAGVLNFCHGAYINRSRSAANALSR